MQRCGRINNINTSSKCDIRLGAESSNASEEYAIRSYLSYYSVILLANNKLQHNSLQYMIKISFRILYCRSFIKQKISCAISYARPVKHHQQAME
jgi:hypothetical protein